jgi:hypothetical protein
MSLNSTTEENERSTKELSKMKRTKITNKRGRTKLACSIACPSLTVEGLPVSYHPSFTLEVDRFGPRELKKALVDSEMITSLLRQHPEEMSKIVNLVLSGQMDRAFEIARKIGFTEEAFQTNGGGFLLIGLIIIASAAMLIYKATH